MKNTVKEDWKRRIRATVCVLAAMMVAAALWCRGRPFAKVLQIGTEDVGRIAVVRQGMADLEITDRETIDAVMSIINHFRYQTCFDRSNLSGCLPEQYVALYSQEGRELTRLQVYNEGIVLRYNDAYLSGFPYFEPLCQQLGL